MSIGLCTRRDRGPDVRDNQSESRQWIQFISDFRLPIVDIRKARHYLIANRQIVNWQSAMAYRFENWKRLRAPFCPYFLRSLIRGSRVINPACFRAGRRSALYSIRARVMPWRIAPAWPAGPRSEER